MIPNTALRRVAIVLSGYVLAFGVALGFVSLHIAASHTPDRQTAQGMYAFGDTVVFLGAFALASLPATGAALFFLRGKPRFWTVLAAIAVGVAMTGVVWALAFHLVSYNGAHGLIQAFSLLFPLRALAAPMFAMVFLLSALMAPARRPRNAMLLATAAEALVFMTTVLRWCLGFYF